MPHRPGTRMSFYKMLKAMRLKWGFAFFGILLVIVISGGLITFRVADSAKKEIQSSGQISAEAIARYLSTSLADVDHAVEIISNYPSVREALLNPDDNALLSAANDDLDKTNHIAQSAVCYLLDLKGKTIASSNRNAADSFIGSYYNFRPYFLQALEKDKGNYFALGVTSGIRGYYSSYTVKDKDHNTLGVAVIKKELDVLEEYLSRHKYAFLVNQEGLVFLANKKEFLGNSLWPISSHRKQQINDSKQFGFPSFKVICDHKFNNFSIIKYKKEHLLAVVYNIQQIGWAVVLLKPISQVITIYAFGVLSVFLCLILWCSIFAWIMQREYSSRLLQESEENYRIVFDSAQDSIFIHDIETGKILDVNATMCKTYGYDYKEAVQLTVGDFSANIDAYSQEKAMEYMQNAAKGQPQDFEWLCKTKDNKLFWAQVNIFKVIIGGRERLLATARDITQSKKNAQLLLEEYARTQRYLDIVGVIIVAITKDKKVSLINKKGCEILGYAEKDIIGQNWFEIFLPSESAEEISQVFESMLNDQTSVLEYYENYILTSSGKRLLIAWHNAVLKNTNGEIVGVLASGEDITEKRTAEQAIVQSEAKYRVLSEELEQGQAATLNILEDLQEAKETLEISRQNFLNIVEKSTDSILIVDNKGAVKFANNSATLLFGRSRDQMVGSPLGIEIKDGIRETTITHSDGSNKIVEMRALNTEWEEVMMTLVLLHDMTERKNAENSLRIAAHEWRVTFDSIGYGLSLLDLDSKIVRCNRALSDFVNKPYAEIIGQDCHELIYGTEEVGDCPIHRTIKTKKRSTRVLHKNEKWLGLSVDPLLNENNDLIGLIHSVTDLTDQKMIEHKLREYTNYVENIIETAQAIIIGLDKDLNIQSINAFAENLLGKNREDIIGRDWLDFLIPAEYRDEITQVLSNCLEGDRVKGYEIPVLTKDNKEAMISWDSAELRDDKNQITGIVIMGYDVSQRKEIEKVQRLAQLGTLVSHMAHEVNNPLMVISGRAQLSLMEDIENEEVKTNLNIVMKECQRAKDIIQRLLRFSRPSKGELKQTDINASLVEVVNLVEHQFGLNNVSIKKDYAPDLPLVLVDEKQIHEVFMNLLTNAQDAISGEGTIAIKTQTEGSFIKITFTDSGEGISKEVLDKIFDPFFTTKKKGTGLGLSICYSIIKAHNGNLSFESVAGEGTTAVIILPYLKEIKDA